MELLPLPSGPRDLHRLRPIFRYTVFTRYYPNEPDTMGYLTSGIAQKIRKNPRFFDDEIGRIAEDLEQRSRWVYPSREKDFDWSGRAGPMKRGR